MNKFFPSKCIPHKDAVRKNVNSKALLLPLIMEKNSNYVLFFPVEDEVAEVINFILENDFDIEESGSIDGIGTIEMVRTMKYSWSALGNFVSGILIRDSYSEELKDYTLDSNIILSSDDGYVESIIKVGFVLAIVFSLLEDVPVMIGDALLEKLNSYNEESEENIDIEIREQDKKIDKEILMAAKKIMGDKKNK